MYTKTDILKEFDLAFNGIPSHFFPEGNIDDIKYNFFLDLEHGYCETAGSKIHLYADSKRWAIIFEKSGYQNRGTTAEIELTYIGNCINYPVNKYPERSYISNSSIIILIDSEEFERIQNKEGDDMETFELIGLDTKTIMVHGVSVPFENDYNKYESFGVRVRDYDNPQRLIGFADIVRYLYETNPDLISATKDEITKYIPIGLPHIMTIDKFHYSSAYDKSHLPSNQELFQQIADILLTKDTTLWQPTLEPNNHWGNWKSGNL